MKKLHLLLFLVCSLLLSFQLEAHPGIGIVIDKAGNVYYTDLKQVWKITPEGKQSIAVKDVHTHELYLDAKGNLFGEHEWYEGEATDKWGNYVWRLSKDDVFEKVIPDVEGFLGNTTLVRDTKGNSYWSKKQGDTELLMKERPNGQLHPLTHHEFNDIRWMHYSAHDQHLYVVDHLTIKKVSPSGRTEIIAKDLKESSPLFGGVADRHYIFGLWTDPQLNLYVALYGAGKVKRIDPSGEISTVFKSSIGWSPCGGLIDPKGTMWIMEFSLTNKTRVRKINPAGKDQVYGG